MVFEFPYVKCMGHSHKLLRYFSGETWQKACWDTVHEQYQVSPLPGARAIKGVASISKDSLVGLRSHQSADSSDLGSR